MQNVFEPTLLSSSKESLEVQNKISVENMSSIYVKEPHPTILIDGKPLDIMLNEICPNELVFGLIPTMVDWMNFDEEFKLVENVFATSHELKIIPILMCPDDCDLSCTLIVAEEKTTQDQVKWNRIGIDMNKPNELINQNRFLESGVKWLDKVPIMTFSKEEYIKSLEKIYRRAN
ncbi:hypothetical protein V3851_06060 [Paenibacillus sp. M1]|uniref:Uncharacterized protein n=1 Tax=Paenibacillus haidiansis TaxID=1574488 RepID=A0ABU7VNP9_9BACL